MSRREQENFWITLTDSARLSRDTDEAVPMKRMVHLDHPCGCTEREVAAFLYWPSRLFVFECSCGATFTEPASAPGMTEPTE